ncbi:MAG: phosphotransferase family protein [Deltaproteobacteria bacterium]|nr:phosphotransferase family protein [Deltaproteobacteria bacterium]
MSELDFTKVERSTLDREETRQRLERWLAERLPKGAEPTIPELSAPSGTGMSSETLLFDASWAEDGERRTSHLVGRLAPDLRDVPVFPKYDLESQFRLLALIAEHSSVPVPGVRWLEKDPAALGAPFFVMDRVDGRVPPDIPPYLFAGWLLEANEAERKQLMTGTVEAVAALHAIDPIKADAGFLGFDVAGDTPLRRHVQNQRDFYAWVVADGVRQPIVERTFEWLDENWPEDEGETVISWGDSRIGNVLYGGFQPVALLDWEMAGLGPREMDLGWLCFMHTFFQNIADMAGQPGMPDFLRLADVAAAYEHASGRAPRDLVWYFTYAALRHGIVMSRIQRRMLHFGQAEPSDDPDSVIPHRAVLEGLLNGEWDPLS